VLPLFVVDNSGLEPAVGANSGYRAQISPYQPWPLQSFSTVDSHFTALESHTARLCDRM